VKGLGTLLPGAAAQLAVTVSLASFIQYSYTQHGEHYGVVVFESRISLGCTILTLFVPHGVTVIAIVQRVALVLSIPVNQQIASIIVLHLKRSAAEIVPYNRDFQK
jgi:uncharacterized membrane protein YjgN (DUF898 family)